MSPSARRSGALIECAVELLLLFGFLLGIGSASTIAYYARSAPQTVWEAQRPCSSLRSVRRLRHQARPLRPEPHPAVGAGRAHRLGDRARLRADPWPRPGLLRDMPDDLRGARIRGFQRLRGEDVNTARLLAASIVLDILNVFTFFLPVFASDGRCRHATLACPRSSEQLPTGVDVEWHPGSALAERQG